MSHLVIAVFVAVRIITSTGLRYRNHNQSFHNLIAHLRLRLDANMRSACFIAHMCTCIPLFLGFAETNILFLPRVSYRDIALQSTIIRRLCITSGKVWDQSG